MGYRAEKIKTEKKKKLLKRILLGILLLCIAALAIFSAFVPPVTWKYRVRLPKISRRGEGELRIHFIDVGQGDCTLIELPDGKTVLIDGGNSATSTEKKILRHLNALKIDVIDYLIVTHADVDHCGGLNEVVKYKKVVNAYLPLSKPEKDSEYKRLFDTLTQGDCNWVYASRQLGAITSQREDYPFQMSFLYPYGEDVDDVIISDETAITADDNDYSAVAYLEYMGIRALFTGDAPQKIEHALVVADQAGLYEKIDVSLQNLDIFKVAHHGGKNANSWEFLQHISPSVAVISCGRGNSYGDPTETVLARLNELHTDLYRTDVDGSIMFTLSAQGYSVRKV